MNKLFSTIVFVALLAGQAWAGELTGPVGGSSGGGGGLNGFLTCTAGVCTFTGADGSTQMVVGTTNSAVDYLQVIGGVAGAGGSIVGASGTDANVAISFTAKGNGSVNFGNSGSGKLAQAVDPGAAVSSNGQVQLTPSTSAGPVKVGNATYGVNLDCGTNNVCQAAGRQFFSVLSKSGTTVSHTGDTADTALATITIPAGALGPNGVMRITSLWTCTNNADVKTARVKLGVISIGSAGSTTIANMMINTVTIAANSTSSQNSQSTGERGTDRLITGGGSVNTTLDMTTSQSIVLSGQLAVAADTISLIGYSIEIAN